jgi:hypothetical protein
MVKDEDWEGAGQAGIVVTIMYSKSTYLTSGLKEDEVFEIV